MRRQFVGAFWVALLCAVLGEEQQEIEEDRITLGLYVLYDSTFYSRAAFGQNNEELTSYFTVLVNTAQAYFRGLSNPSLTLTLVDSGKLWDEKIVTYISDQGKRFVDAEATLPSLEHAVRSNKSLPENVDVVFLITGLETKTREESFTKDWKGLSPPKAICFFDEGGWYCS
uniref:Putative metalloprotease n=1 Tax=Amblyomma cajennense TaxID=34607 RepID=A0A023FTG0_AMBCJ